MVCSSIVHLVDPVTSVSHNSVTLTKASTCSQNILWNGVAFQEGEAVKTFLRRQEQAGSMVHCESRSRVTSRVFMTALSRSMVQASSRSHGDLLELKHSFPAMAPGYRSPFDHLSSPKTNHDHHHTAAILPFLAVLLCISIISCIVAITFRAAAERTSLRGQQHIPIDGTVGSPPDMVFDEAAIMKPFVVRSGRVPQSATDIRHVLLREEGCGVESGGMQQPGLPADGHGSPWRGDGSIIELAAQKEDMHEKGFNNSWHGTNALNTSWGWMA